MRVDEQHKAKDDQRLAAPDRHAKHMNDTLGRLEGQQEQQLQQEQPLKEWLQELQRQQLPRFSW
jgi:hypothetical protein